MLKIIRFVFGYITFSATGRFPERFINLTGTRGICLFDVQKSKDGFVCSSIATEFPAILKLAKRSFVDIKIIKKKGIPFILKKYKKRYGIIIGMLLFILIQFLLSFFVWDISVRGNNNIESEEILNLANGFGIKNGILKSSINASILENYILNEFPNISWASVNLTGSRLNLEVKEKTIPPELIPSNFPCNIISDSDAQIVRLEIYSGKPEVKVGDAVTKGQILVNGITEDSLGNSKCCQAEAKIFSKIKKTIKEEIYLEQINKIKKNKKIKRKNLTFFNVNIPLNFLPIPKGNYERKFKVKNLTLFNKKLPVTLYEEIWNKFEINRTFLAFPKAKELALENISRREKLELNDIKILNYEDNFKKFNNRIILNRFYTCIKDISKKEQITMR